MSNFYFSREEKQFVLNILGRNEEPPEHQTMEDVAKLLGIRLPDEKKHEDAIEMQNEQKSKTST